MIYLQLLLISTQGAPSQRSGDNGYAWDWREGDERIELRRRANSAVTGTDGGGVI